MFHAHNSAPTTRIATMIHPIVRAFIPRLSLSQRLPHNPALPSIWSNDTCVRPLGNVNPALMFRNLSGHSVEVPAPRDAFQVVLARVFERES